MERIYLKNDYQLNLIISNSLKNTPSPEQRRGPMHGLLRVCLWRLDQEEPGSRVGHVVGPAGQAAGTAGDGPEGTAGG